METKVLVGVISGIIITLIGFILNGIRVKHREIDNKMSCKVDEDVHKMQVRKFDEMFKSNNERLKILESEIKEILEATARIEQKLVDMDKEIK